jgi:hypothetical protein
MRTIIGFFTDYQQCKFLDWFFTSPLYLGLFTTRPTRLRMTEVKADAGNGYQRTLVPPGIFAPAINGWSRNLTPITLPAPLGDWGTIQSIGFFDTPTAGNLLTAIGLNQPITISAGDPPRTYAPEVLNVNRS